MKFILEVDEIKARAMNQQKIFIEFFIEDELFFRSESIAEMNPHVYHSLYRSGKSTECLNMKQQWIICILGLQ